MLTLRGTRLCYSLAATEGVAMTETGERAIFDIMFRHLEVTERLLGNFIDLVSSIRQSPAIANLLPASFPTLPALQELRSSTSSLRERVQSTLDLR